MLHKKQFNHKLSSEILDAAVDYAKRGWAVFPCRPKGKEPLTKNGVKDASTDAKQIEQWWSRFPDANLAIATGPISGVWVVDVDRDEAKDIDGETSLTDLEGQHGQLPDTIKSNTGRGGSHVFFSWLRHALGADAPGAT